MERLSTNLSRSHQQQKSMMLSRAKDLSARHEKPDDKDHKRNFLEDYEKIFKLKRQNNNTPVDQSSQLTHQASCIQLVGRFSSEVNKYLSCFLNILIFFQVTQKRDRSSRKREALVCFILSLFKGANLLLLGWIKWRCSWQWYAFECTAIHRLKKIKKATHIYFTQSEISGRKLPFTQRKC